MDPLRTFAAGERRLLIADHLGAIENAAYAEFGTIFFVCTTKVASFDVFVVFSIHFHKGLDAFLGKLGEVLMHVY